MLEFSSFWKSILCDLLFWAAFVSIIAYLQNYVTTNMSHIATFHCLLNNVCFTQLPLTVYRKMSVPRKVWLDRTTNEGVKTSIKKYDAVSMPTVKKSLTLSITYSILHHHHHHHWLDSPWWALAFLRSFVHSSLLRATLFQFLTSNILMSCSTPSSHRSFGLPTLLTPSGLALNIFLMVLSLFIRARCPAHANLLTLIGKDIKKSKVSNWKTLVQDRRWKELIEKAKTQHKEL